MSLPGTENSLVQRSWGGANLVQYSGEWSVGVVVWWEFWIASMEEGKGTSIYWGFLSILFPLILKILEIIPFYQIRRKEGSRRLNNLPRFSQPEVVELASEGLCLILDTLPTLGNFLDKRIRDVYWRASLWMSCIHFYLHSSYLFLNVWYRSAQESKLRGVTNHFNLTFSTVLRHV